MVKAMHLDNLKWFAITLIVITGIVANQYLNDYLLFYRVLGLLLLLGLAVAIALQTDLGKRAWVFLQDSRMEVRKVVWPTQQETVQTGLIVIGIVFVVALFLWLVDSVLVKIISLVTTG